MELTDLSHPSFDAGSVWLVGSGPGDAGLLTLHALYALRTADIIVYDALVSDSILSLSKTESRTPIMEYAGKRGGKPSIAQRSISMRLVELAKAGNRVCRLKGGDPFVFARGAEEALVLSEHNVPFRVISGVTAGIGGLGSSYIPLTHRDINHHVSFLTGHDANGSVPNLDWSAIARAGGVLVFYMAMRNIREISQNLLNGGRASSEPMAFLSNATTPKEQLHITTLGDVAASGAPVSDVPAIIVIGDVVDLRKRLIGDE